MEIFADSITPFLIDKADVRGRLVKLQGVAHTILSRYPYPDGVTHILGELLVVAAMLSSNLKQEGIFTVQIRGSGLVPLLVVDAAYGGQLRGFAEVSDAARSQIEALGATPTPRQLFGEDAYFAITLDPGEGMQRYQGVVGLEGESVTDALTHYFTHSQQVEVLFKLAVTKPHGHWIAAGLMVERLPPEQAAHSEARDDEAWRYASAIAQTLTPEELVDPLLDAPSLLYRLYHEEGVWVQDALPVQSGCRCSRERIERLLLSMPDTDRADMIVDGVAKVHCQFCNTTQVFTPEELGLNVS